LLHTDAISLATEPSWHVACLKEDKIGPNWNWQVVKLGEGPLCKCVTPFFPFFYVGVLGFVDEVE
jgi:hypothetical protein